MLNKRHVYDTFQRKLDNDISVLKNEMCFYLIMLNIHANLQHTFYCYQRSIFFRYKFDLLPANSGLHEHGFWPTSLCILLCAAMQCKTIKV